MPPPPPVSSTPSTLTGPAVNYLRGQFDQFQRSSLSASIMNRAVSIAKELVSSYECDGDKVEEALGDFVDLALCAPKSEVRSMSNKIL